MTARGMDAATLRESARDAIVAYDLLEVDLTPLAGQPAAPGRLSGPDQVYRMTSGPRDAMHDGNTFHSVGSALAFTEIKETARLHINEVSFTLSGTVKDQVQYLVLNDFIDRPVKLWRQLWNPADGVVGTFQIFGGSIAKSAFRVTADSVVIVVTAANRFVDIDRRNGRRTNNGSQQYWFPGDWGFEFARQVLTQVPFRPGVTPAPPPPTPPPSGSRNPGRRTGDDRDRDNSDSFNYGHPR